MAVMQLKPKYLPQGAAHATQVTVKVKTEAERKDARRKRIAQLTEVGSKLYSSDLKRLAE